jgi:Tfp pilus assembly protein PilN
MLKINLLPSSVRQGSASTLEQLHRTPLMAVLVGGMVLILVLLGIPVQLQRQRLQQLQQRISELKPRKAEVDQLRQFMDDLRAQELAFEALERVGRRWSKRLNTLSNVMPDGVWFNEMTVEKAKRMVLQGAAVGEGGRETESINRLVQDLKSDPDFSAAVSNLQIESIKRIQDHEIEIMQFTLTGAVEGSQS